MRERRRERGGGKEGKREKGERDRDRIEGNNIAIVSQVFCEGRAVC